MDRSDLEYVCTVMGNLSSMPIRLFEGEEQIFYHCVVNLPKDPMTLHKKDVFAVTANIGYYITPLFYYYGIINSGNFKIVIGPTRQVPATEQDLREIALHLDLYQELADTFVSAMKTIVTFPLGSIMQMLCVVNYVLNGEKVKLEDISIYEPLQDELIKNFEERRIDESFNYELPKQETHNTLFVEQTIMNIVEKGDIAALQEWIKSAPAVRSGIMSSDQIRQLKNLFIVTVTLASRAAIRGGMDAEKALSLSDLYIQKCELLNTISGLTNLQYRMITDYTEQVERIRIGKQPIKLVLDVANYIQNHLSDSITTQEIAEHLFISRSRLSTKFKAETGTNLTDFILQQKTDEAKRLLRYSDKSLLAISSYLGFSSASHFSNVFKKYTGKTPKEYRELHNK